MLGAKVPKELVLAKIQVSRSQFDVTATGLVSLNTSKVPEDVIKAMMLPPAPPVQAAPIPVKEAPAAPATTAAPTTTPPKTATKADSAAKKTAAPAKAPPKTTPPPVKKPPVPPTAS